MNDNKENYFAQFDDAPTNEPTAQQDNYFAQFDKPQRLTIPEQEPSLLTKARDVTRSLLQGTTLGFADEIGSAVASIPAAISEGEVPFVSGRGREIYRDMQQGVHDEQEQFKADNPLLSTGLEIAGSIPLALTGAGSVASGATLKEAVKQGAKLGAGFGATYGAGTSGGNLSSLDDAGELAKDTALGGAIGTVTGGAIPVAAAGLKGAGRAAKSLFKDLRSSGNQKAIKAITQQADELGTTPEKLLAKLDELGEEATLADLDKAFARQASAAYSKAPSTQGRIDKNLDVRQSMQGGDIKREFIDSLGDTTSDNLTDALDKLAKERSSKASPLYKKAFDSDFAEDLSKNKIMRMPNIQKALRAGENMAKNDPDRIATKGALKPVERLHYAKKALWDQAQELKRAGKGGEALNIDKQRKAIDGILDTIPEYKQARNLWADSMDMEAAADIGKNILKTSVDADDFARSLKGMSDSEMEMAKLSALKEVVRKLDFKGDTDNMTKMLKGSEGMRNKLRAIFNSDEEMQRYVSKISKWDTFQKTRNLIKGGSDTQLKQEAAGALDKMLSAMMSAKATAADYALEKIGGESAKKAAKSTARLLTSKQAARPVLEKMQKNALAESARGGLGSRTAVGLVQPANVLAERAK